MYSGFQSPGFRILLVNFSRISYPTSKKIYRILPMSSRLSLHRSINMDNSSIVGSEFTFLVKKSHQLAQEYINADDITTVIS